MGTASVHEKDDRKGNLCYDSDGRAAWLILNPDSNSSAGPHYGEQSTPKNGKTRIIPMNADVMQALDAHRHRKGIWVFCDKMGAPLRDNLCKAPIKRAYKQAGLRHISWHVLRHTFASHLVMRGAPLPTVQELMGHSTITMTMRYAHLSPDAKRDAVKLLQSYGTIAAQTTGSFSN